MASLEYLGTNTKLSKFYKSIHRCKKCPYVTKSMFFMKNHVRRHKTPHPFRCAAPVETFSCYECQFTSNLAAYFNQHVQQYHHHTAPKTAKFTPNRYACANCAFVTHFALTWLRHQSACARRKGPRPPKRFECDHCPAHYGAPRDLREHVNMRHTASAHARWFTCRLCDLRTRHRDVLRRHMAYKHGDAKWYECDQCDYRSHFLANLQQHVVTQHMAAEDIRWFRCGECDYRAKLKQTLKYHVETKHTPEMVKCNRCTFRTAVDSVLARHKRDKHGGDKGGKGSDWRKCEECDVFVGKKHWSRHQKEKHVDPENVRWFGCELCSFKSIRKCALRRHQRNLH